MNKNEKKTGEKKKTLKKKRAKELFEKRKREDIRKDKGYNIAITNVTTYASNISLERLHVKQHSSRNVNHQQLFWSRHREVNRGPKRATQPNTMLNQETMMDYHTTWDD